MFIAVVMRITSGEKGENRDDYRDLGRADL